MKNRATLLWIFKNTKKYLPAVVFIAVLSAIVSVGYIVLAYISSYVIDIATGQKQGNIVFYIALLFLLIAMQAVLFIVNSSIKVRVSGKIEMHFKHNMFSSLMKKEYKNISGIHSGDILNRFTSDVDVVISGVVGIIPSAVGLVARLAAAFVVLVSFSPELTLLIVAVGIIVGFSARIYSKYFKNIHKQVQKAAGDTRSYMQECTENIVVVKTFNSANSFGDKLKSYMLKTYNLKLHRNFISNIANVSIYILFTGGYYAALAWGAFMVSGSLMTYGTLTALLSIVSQVRTPITNMSGLIPQYYSALASAERIMELENLPNEPEPLPATDIKAIYEGMKDIALRNITFSYDGKHDVMTNADMTIKKGEMVALIGGSGEGKSTIFRMLLGLYQKDSGEVLVRGKDNIEITPSIRGLFAYVPQGNLILSGTIADNIRFCNTSATEEEMFAAAKCADLYDFVMTLPQKFDTVVGERGAGLSEGQIQRISIARAILCGAPVLLLDECTSSLDEKTEKIVLKNIKEMNNRTALIISHRPAALEICDKVYALENGMLREKEF